MVAITASRGLASAKNRSSDDASQHIVKRGDTLWQIARDHNVPLRDLIAANPQIANPDLIYPGQAVNIPAGAASPAPSSEGCARGCAQRRQPDANGNYPRGGRAKPAPRGGVDPSSVGSMLPDRPAANDNVPAPNVPGGRYDGRTPAGGTTNTRAWIPVDAPLQNRPGERSASKYADVLDQFAVGSNPRYARRDGNTYCNIFSWDATRAMGAEIPHWVDRNGNSAAVGAPGAREMDANATNQWLHTHGARHGWRRVSAAEAQRMANEGHPAVASWKNPGGIGHIAMVRPGELTAGGPAIAQAGARNFNQGHVADGFGGAQPEYWVHD